MAIMEYYVCDRCKEPFDLDHGILGLRTGRFVRYRNQDIAYRVMNYDLCPECAEALDVFLNPEAKEEAEEE